MADETKPAENFRPVNGTILYRSSKLNDLSRDGIEHMTKIGIKSIIDLRSCRESGGTRQKLIDLYYSPVAVERADKISPITQRQNAKLKQTEVMSVGYHFYAMLMEDDVIDKLYAKARWYVKILYWLCLFLDFWFEKWITLRVLALFTMDEETTPYKNLSNYITNCGAKIFSVLNLLKDRTNSPAILVCEYGRDRTGVVAMLLQMICGVDEHKICRDYARSQDELKESLVSLRKAIKRFRLPSSYLESRYEWMQDLIGYIKDRYGSIEGYLSSIGFSSEDQAVLRENIMQYDVRT